MSIRKARLLSALLLAASLAPLSLVSQSSQSITIRAGVPLRIQIDHHYRVRAGTRIEGHLIAPVYSVDHGVLPVNTRVTGTILGMQRDPQQSRVRALLNGQFTAPAVPAVRFDSLRLPSGATLPIRTSVTERDASVVTMSTRKKKKSGLRARAHSMVQAKKHGILDIIRHPNSDDRIRKLIYSQLPWYPPTIWSGTQYDAELTAPLTIPGSQPSPLPDAPLHSVPTGIINARLLTPLNSATDHRGTPVVAILTRPLLTPDGKQVVFPEGARMKGIVAVTRRARWFGRNGQLRFTFRSIERNNAVPTVIHGQLAAAETASGTHVKINQEGEAKSSSGPGKYLAPMALGAMTASALDSDATSNPMHSGTATNSFGFAARTAVMVTANAVLLHVLAIYAVSMSVYTRWIARGHEVNFPKDTRVQILLNQR